LEFLGSRLLAVFESEREVSRGDLRDNPQYFRGG
jgi:hypothetical protein